MPESAIKRQTLSRPLHRQHINWVHQVSQHHDKHAYKELYSFYAPRLKSWLQQQGLNSGVAEEITQECMITVWQKAMLFNEQKGSVASWIYTIARNLKIDAQRKDKALPDDYPEPVLMYAEERMVEKILSDKSLTLLPNDQSQILKEFYKKGYSQQEIADRHCLPLGTVKSRIRLALAKLAAMYQ